MTFARAEELVDYLAGLGVSHLYASPVFAAVPGSSHGYDGVDFGSIEPAIGGDDGFARLCAALSSAELGLIIDFVPNHMAAAEQNAWWWGVLELGRESPFAAYFDIDWSQPKLLLPILGTTYADALEEGVFGLGFDAERGELFFTCYDRRLPLTPPSYELVLEHVDRSAVAGMANRFSASTYEAGEALKSELARCASDPENAGSIERAIARVMADRERLNGIHEAQVWHLVHWRMAREALTYRRFFEIADLICLRVEDPLVFEAVHARLFALIAAGKISGVRIDHLDGLADPRLYIQRFRAQADEGKTQYLLVEKIIEPGEQLRSDWPVDGTTGYEFIAALADVLVDHDREAAMRQAYEAFTGERTEYAVAAAAAKREIFERNLAAELAYLTRQAAAVAAHDPRSRSLGADSLRGAIVAMAAALPVYRTYVDQSGPDEADRVVIAKAAQAAKASRAVEDTAAIDFIEDLLLVDVDDASTRDTALAFAVRFQQTSGPVMAKAIEDTLFYRYNRLIALNEVGGSPERYGAPVADFHRNMSERMRMQPGGLSATATHDTKRGEDARARLYVLSEIPQIWHEAVLRWSNMNARHRVGVGRSVPEPNIEWLFYQALAGVWPAGMSTDNKQVLGEVRSRMLAYMTKTVREAKTRTSWIDIDEDYEGALGEFVAATLADGNAPFLDDFVRTCRPVWLAGAVNSLAQLAIKLTAPGVPDFYQGSELWDLSLVDPDNRTPVDYAVRAMLLDRVGNHDCASLLEEWETGAPKMFLTATGLRLRANLPGLFASGEYVPLNVVGGRSRNLITFARVLEDECVLLVVPRFVFDLTQGASQPLVPPQRWGDTAIELPVALQNRPMRDVLTGSRYPAGPAISVASLLGCFPVAMLVADTN